ncbi:MAG: lysyl oxidase family protein [Candidatus Sericytochromatia bacterium]|nr:lysyl oxidase family protein [Candidatus Sericytochromatia bacterium]
MTRLPGRVLPLLLGMFALAACGPRAQGPVGAADPAQPLPEKAFWVDKENLVDGEIHPGAYDPLSPPYRLSAIGTLVLTGAESDGALAAFPPGAAIDGDTSSQWANGSYRASSAWWSARLSQPAALSSVRLKTGPLPSGVTYDLAVRSAGSWITVATGLRNTSWQLETKRFPARLGDALRVSFRNDAALSTTRFMIFECQAVGDPDLGTGTASPSPLPSATPTPQPLPTGSVDQTALRLASDLRAIAPGRLQLTYEGGRRFVRFDNTIPNVGAGPFQVRAYNSDGVTRAYQEILDGTGRVVATKYVGAFDFHPAHNHFHLGDVALYQLRTGSPTGPLERQGYKVSFCLLDSVRYSSNAAPSAYGGCNQVLQGISRGWADLYDRALPGQEFDVTGYPSGQYYLVTLSDPTNKFVDPDRSNEVAWVRFYMDPARGSLQVLSRSTP